jgi:hypothetical protein
MGLGMHSDSDTPRCSIVLILDVLGSGLRTRLGDTFWGPLPLRIAALADALVGPTGNPGGSPGDIIAGEAPDLGATLLFWQLSAAGR